jgi:hypothetical protein
MPLVESYLEDEVPFVFLDKPGSYSALRASLAESFSLSKVQIFLVGSAKFGFSMSPEKFGTAFSPHSDIDVDIVSRELFDELWFDLLELTPARRSSLSSQAREWIETHRQWRIFFGRAEPQRLSGATRLAGRWFRAFRSLSRVPDLARYEVHGMLFRTHQHLRLHHANGFRTIRNRERGQD